MIQPWPYYSSAPVAMGMALSPLTVISQGDLKECREEREEAGEDLRACRGRAGEGV